MSDHRGRSARHRLIVALDVPTHQAAIELVETLDHVSFFKIGLPLLFAKGDIGELLDRIQRAREDDGGIFVDLKLAGDIGDTITRFVEVADGLGIRFITLADAAAPAINEHAIAAGRAARERLRTVSPEFLMVPLLSSLAGPTTGSGIAGDDYIVERGRMLLDRGCDGLIVSGEAIGRCREAFPTATLVSPGIRPEGSRRTMIMFVLLLPCRATRASTKRSWQLEGEVQPGGAGGAGAAGARQLGADYLVVTGRPIIEADIPRDAAERIINEIAYAESNLKRPIREGTYLERQKASYNRMRPELEHEHLWKWVVFHEEELAGVFGGFEAAAEEAVSKFGRGPFMIKQIGASEEITLPASLMYHPV